MNDFSSQYIELLKRQVAEEIEFLTLHNHKLQQNSIRCIFCYEGKGGVFNCNRMHELRQFQSSIVVTTAQQINLERRNIGFECEVKCEVTGVENKPLQLPQLLQPL